MTSVLPPNESPSLPSVLDGEQLDDPRTWLEDVDGEKQLEWAKACNAETAAQLGDPSQSPLFAKLASILDSKEKIPYIGRVLNGLYYNFWQDETHVRGIWRRCTLEEYRKPDPAWETVLDIDALNEEEGESWVWGGSTVLDEGADATRELVMLKLSPGGSDAAVAREFSLATKRFIPATDGGFVLPLAKSSFKYKDRDLMIVSTDFGDGSMTDSGYPRTVRYWKRGTPLSEATLEYEGEATDVSVGGYAYHDRGHSYEWRYRALTFYTTTEEVRMPEGGFSRVPVPDDAETSTFADQILVTLRSDWELDGTLHAAGSLLAFPLLDFMRGERADLTTLFAPSKTVSLEGTSSTRNYLIIALLDDVRSELKFWRYAAGGKGGGKGGGGGAAGSWTLEEAFRSESINQISASGVDADTSDAIWVTSSGYTQPSTYSIAEAASPAKQETLKVLPSFYNAEGQRVEQYKAVSADGTEVPYFIVSREDVKLDGTTPTLLYGYGGFEISLTPRYNAHVGASWLEDGHAYVEANIRGGGEYGPGWHQAALKEKRHKAYEDFEAVARDLIARGVTSPPRLGIMGGSNGGLLVGNMLVRTPELFGAVVCQVPLLDMRRYNKLLAGASWMGEFGNPDTDDWKYVQKYSPYHRLRTPEETAYPSTLFTTSTRDDRVHPGHARKMVAKMKELGIPQVFYYENIEGGHGGAADNRQRAYKLALEYAFLQHTLVDK